MSDLTPDQRVAAKLGTHPEQVGAARNNFNESAEGAIVRAALADRLDQLFIERIRKLRKCKAEELTRIQGEADALELAIATVSKKLE